MSSSELFLAGNEENGDYNQYWYSKYTIDIIVQDLIKVNGKIAFLSTPSVYFAMPIEFREMSYCFDYDKKWEADRGFIFFDFNKIETIPKHLFNTFDIIVIDPPFIVKEVWVKYAEAANLLLKSGFTSEGIPLGKVILTTVIENADLLHSLFGAKPTVFQPSIPNLVYQYNLFTNYPSELFSHHNPEIPE